MAQALLIIDVQKDFTEDLNQQFIINCQKEINKAVINNHKIIFVEFISFGKTLTRLSRLTKNYKNKIVVRKDAQDGAYAINPILNMLNIKTMKVCGVYTSACVISTIRGLHRINKQLKIKVIEDACSDSFPENHFVALKRMRRLKNVTVI